MPESITILNTPVHAVSMKQTLHLVRRYMAEPGLHQIATTNPEFVMRAQRDEQFRQVLQQADLCIPDGVGLLLASRWMGTPLAERVPGSELVYNLAELASQECCRLFLLGAGPGVADEAARIFQSQYPELKIAGTYAGSPDPSDDELIVQRINDSQADMLFVAYGARANEDAFRDVLKTFAALTVETFSETDVNAADRYNEIRLRANSALAFQGGTQAVEDIIIELTVAKVGVGRAAERHQACDSILRGIIGEAENADIYEVSTQILSLQGRIEASLQVLASLSRLSILNFI